MSNGVARSGWDKDLRDGEAREDAFAYVLLRARVEHKSDEKARATGNAFIEIAQPDPRTGQLKASGINVSRADWWAIEVDRDTWVLLPRQRLLNLAAQIARDEPSRVVMGGDGNQYKGVLVPLSKLLRPLQAVK